MKKYKMLAFGMVLFSFLVGIAVYQQMPEKMASHWNAQGAVDGYMPRFWAVFLMPLISLGMFLLFLAIPRIDPMRANIYKFRKYFDGFIVIIFAFLLYLYALTLFWNMGIKFSIILFLVPAFAALFYYMGILVENAKRNWFIGIRTPWTLSSDKVWDKTHKIGGKLFKASAIISLLGLFFIDYAILFVIVPVILVAIFTIVYSYAEYTKLETKKK